jgi:hypothetical protein
VGGDVGGDQGKCFMKGGPGEGERGSAEMNDPPRQNVKKGPRKFDGGG